MPQCIDTPPHRWLGQIPLCVCLAVALLVPFPLRGEETSPGEEALNLERLAFMVGSWRAMKGTTVLEELWTAPRGGLMLGLNRQVSERGSQWEFLRIEQSDEGVVYWASPGGQPATPFKLIQAGEGRAVFANPEHDFPQRLIYTREGDSLNARVEAGSGDDVRGFDLRWTLAASLD